MSKCKRKKQTGKEAERQMGKRYREKKIKTLL
jgi:hypothetical protein